MRQCCNYNVFMERFPLQLDVVFVLLQCIKLDFNVVLILVGIYNEDMSMFIILYYNSIDNMLTKEVSEHPAMGLQAYCQCKYYYVNVIIIRMRRACGILCFYFPSMILRDTHSLAKQ